MPESVFILNRRPKEECYIVPRTCPIVVQEWFYQSLFWRAKI